MERPATERRAVRSEKHFKAIRLPLGPDDFHQLPRNPAYKYELIQGETWLSPRPRFFHAVLTLESFQVPSDPDVNEEYSIRPLEPADWQGLPDLFAAAFDRVPPFGSLRGQERVDAAGECLEQTRTGGDGPLIERACFVAAESEEERVCGVLLVTLIPNVDVSTPVPLRWETPPPPDCIEKRLGRPHLTWVFVSPWRVGHGLGSALLAAAVRELLALGYPDLASTFLLGNDGSMLWHWRNGFQLVPHAYSWRAMRQRWQE